MTDTSKRAMLDLVKACNALGLTPEQASGLTKQAKAWYDLNTGAIPKPEDALSDQIAGKVAYEVDWVLAGQDGEVSSTTATYAQLLLEMESRNPVHSVFQRRHFRVMAAALSQNYTIQINPTKEN